ncbi:GAF domain-containing protein [Microvirga sp. 0TCS3.31]
MEFIPETLEALDELEPFADDAELRESLERSADLAQRLVPDLAGISVASYGDGLTFTLVATDEEIAALDGVQYLSSGPCVEALDDGRGMATTSDDLLSEPRWRALGLASAAAGVRSTLTLPIVTGEKVTGTVNLYGRSDNTFDGRHATLAVIFRAWAPGAVTNADLSFSTRKVAEQAPEQLRDAALLDQATGMLAAAEELPLDVARERLIDAATRAGISVTRLARALVTNRDNDT